MVSGHGGEVHLQLRYHVELGQSERAVSRGIPGRRVSGYASRGSRTTRGVSGVHGAWRRVDGVSLRGLALTPSAYPANWDWYHNTFLGAGSYVSNTWRPTSAVLRVE